MTSVCPLFQIDPPWATWLTPARSRTRTGTLAEWPAFPSPSWAAPSYPQSKYFPLASSAPELANAATSLTTGCPLSLLTATGVVLSCQLPSPRSPSRFCPHA